MNLLSILLQTPSAAPASAFDQWKGILMMLGLVVVFYFFMIRPQQKKQKEVARMRESLKVGDKVLTSGGIYGRIKEVNDDSFLVEIADNVKIKVDKASVFAVNESQPSK